MFEKALLLPKYKYALFPDTILCFIHDKEKRNMKHDTSKSATLLSFCRRPFLAIVVVDLSRTRTSIQQGIPAYKSRQQK